MPGANCREWRIRGRVDAERLARAVAGVSYEPPGFERLVLYTLQFCKTPLPGQALGPPRGEFEEKGLLYGELFRAKGYTLIDIDFMDDIDPFDVWVKLVEQGGARGVLYPTRRGLHLFVEGDLEAKAFEATVFGHRARVEVKPCKNLLCTSFYRSLNAFRIGDRIVAVNGRYGIIIDTSSYKVRRVDVFYLEPFKEGEAESLLGVRLSRMDEARFEARYKVIKRLDIVRSLGSLTPTRLAYNQFKAYGFIAVPVDPRTVIEAIDRLYAQGLLPPCLEPVATGVHSDNRFATIVLLVAALTKAGLGLRRDSSLELCDLLVERWGGSLNQCKSKLKSILVCFGDACIYAYGSNLLRSVSYLWSCDPARCPVRGCPGPARPKKAVEHLARYLRGYILRAVFGDALRRIRFA